MLSSLCSRARTSIVRSFNSAVRRSIPANRVQAPVKRVEISVDRLESRRHLAAFSLDVNFQPNSSWTPAGFSADTGKTFGWQGAYEVEVFPYAAMAPFEFGKGFLGYSANFVASGNGTQVTMMLIGPTYRISPETTDSK